MRTTSVCVLAAIGSANAFITLPAVPTARSVTIMPRARAMRMDARSEASKAGDKAQDAAQHLKQAGKEALNSGSGSASNNSSSSSSKTTTTASTAGSATVKGAAVGVTADSKETVWEAPVEKVRIHEREEIVDKTKVEEQRIRTEVRQIVQPIKDSQTRQEEVRSVDHGTQVREHGSTGLDAKTEAELKRRREELAQDAGTTRDKTTVQTNLRPDVEKKEFVNVVEQVVPVIERDVFVPKKIEHEKKVVEIYNEAPVVKATEIKEAITKEEFEKRYGGKVEGQAATTTPTAHTTKVEQKETKHTKSVGGNAVASSSTTQTGSVAGTGAAATKPIGFSAGRGAGGVTGTTTTGTTNVGATNLGATNLGATSAGSTVKTDLKTKADVKTEAEPAPAPYSMSSSNMIHDAEVDAEAAAETENTGLIGSIKEKLKNILD